MNLTKKYMKESWKISKNRRAASRKKVNMSPREKLKPISNLILRLKQFQDTRDRKCLTRKIFQFLLATIGQSSVLSNDLGILKF